MRHIFQADLLRRFVRTTLRMVAGGYELLWFILDGYKWLWLVLGGYGWFWVVVGGYGV